VRVCYRVRHTGDTLFASVHGATVYIGIAHIAPPSRNMAPFRPFLLAALVVLAILAATAALLALGGYDVRLALGALWTGSLGSWYALTSATLVRAIPLMLSGCAVAIAFRAGVFNIGAEGQLLVGAAAATAAALAAPRVGPLALPLALALGALGGAAWASIAAVLRSRFGVLEVISTIMLNFVALYAISYLVRGVLQEPTHAYPQTSPIAAAARLPQIPGAGRLHVGILLAIVVILVVGYVLRRTASGFRVIAVGESPSAAASAGLIDVGAVTTRTFLVSGALAGLAGAVEVQGVTYALYENISPGYGYTAIAVALLAGLDPWRVAFSALLFAALEAGAGAMQRDAGVPSTLVSVIEALLILAVIGAQAFRRRDGRVGMPTAPALPTVARQ
jgi:general nucleoside transport system permease protein